MFAVAQKCLSELEAHLETMIITRNVLFDCVKQKHKYCYFVALPILYRYIYIPIQNVLVVVN